MSSFSDPRADQRAAPRAKVRLSARAETYSRYSLDSQNSADDQVTDIVVNDLSAHGLCADSSDDLIVGAIVRLQIPLVGWRNAEVRWLRDGHAGCRFLVPLREDELRAAIAASPIVSANFPGLVPQIASRQPARIAPVEPALVEPALRRAPWARSPATLLPALGIVIILWAIIFELFL